MAPIPWPSPSKSRVGWGSMSPSPEVGGHVGTLTNNILEKGHYDFWGHAAALLFSGHLLLGPKPLSKESDSPEAGTWERPHLGSREIIPAEPSLPGIPAEVACPGGELSSFHWRQLRFICVYQGIQESIKNIQESRVLVLMSSPSKLIHKITWSQENSEIIFWTEAWLALWLLTFLWKK